METLELLKLVNAKKSALSSIDYTKLSLSEFAVESSLFSGQQRSIMWESWYTANLGAEKVNSTKDRGDLKIGDIYIELKTRYLSDKDISKGIVHTAGQVRLWQNTDYYLFVTINKDNYSVSQYLVKKSDFYNLLKENKVSHGNSHVAGVDKSTYLDLTKKVELGVSLDTKKYDWQSHKINIDELKARLTS